MTEALQHIDTIIFDFDGTIADTMDLGVKVSNEIAKKYRYKRIENQQQLDGYRNQSTQQALKAIGISLIKLPLVAAAFRRKFTKSIDELQPIAGIPAVIRQLASKYTIGVVTSNSEENTKQFMKKHGLHDDISHYATGIHLFKKYRTITKMIKRYGLRASQVLIIGDETRDIEAAHQCHTQVISVTWGFHTSDILATYHPDYMVHEPQELSDLLL